MIRFERRLENDRWVAFVAPVAAVVIALVIAGIMLLVSGHPPLTTYREMIRAAFTNPGALSSTLLTATPLVFTGLCVAVAFPLRAYNVGGEGQLYLGAMGASAIGIWLGHHGAGIVIPAMIAAGIAGGAVWAALPALLRAYLHTSEILTSLMLNYVAALLGAYLIFDSRSYWRDLSSPRAQVFPQGKQLASSGSWPALPVGSVAIPLGFVIGIGTAVMLLLMLRYTRFGFRVRVISASEKAGRYAGMRTRRTLATVLIMSGALAGVAGASQVGDFSHFFDPKGLQQAAYGYTGIVAAALGRFNPIGVVVAAVFLGAIENAGFALQGETFSFGLVGIIEGIILLCILSAELFARYRIVVRVRSSEPPLVQGDPHDADDASAPAAASSFAGEPIES